MSVQSRRPDITGHLGKAWKVNLAIATQYKPWQATLSLFIVNLPGVVREWSWYLIGTIHLRDLPGVQKANRLSPEYEFELCVIALDPEKPLPDPDRAPNEQSNIYHMLVPEQVRVQFHNLDDKEAVHLTEAVVMTTLAGALPPVPQATGHWWKAIGELIQSVHPKVLA